MASNANTAHQPEHAIYLAGTGGGKTTALKNNPALPFGKGRFVFWDPDKDYYAVHIDNLRTYMRELGKAINSGKPFRMAYSPPDGLDTPENFERWCRIIWAYLDGDYKTHVVVEELADVSVSSGKSSPCWGRLLRKGRKYGAVIHMVSQRPQEISKTAINQCTYKFVGIQNTSQDALHASKLAGIDIHDITNLKQLEFMVQANGQGIKKINATNHKAL